MSEPRTWIIAVSYRGIANYTVKAETEDEAMEAAEKAFINDFPETHLGNEYEEPTDFEVIRGNE